MKNIYYSIYGLVFLVLKPLITFIAFPKSYIYDYETFNRPLGFHLEEYFDYHNEAFLYSLIITAILFLMFDRKNLLKK